MKHQGRISQVHSAKDELNAAKAHGQEAGLFAFTDQEFLLREELRPIRLQLELLKPELTLNEYQITDGIAFFGSARIPTEQHATEHLNQAQAALEQDSENPELQHQLKRAQNLLKHACHRKHAVQLARKLSQAGFVVFTGGGPGFMEAANEGAQLASAHHVSLNMCLPDENKEPNTDPKNLSFYFHYFSIRKMHFLLRAKAVVVFPGGFGTFDELFETLTLIQTQKLAPIPIIMFDKVYWDRTVNFHALIEEGVINEPDYNLMTFVNSDTEAFYQLQSHLGFSTQDDTTHG